MSLQDEKVKSVHYDEAMDWRDYHQLSVIYKFMDDLEADFPALCTTGIIGTSVEGRGLKVTFLTLTHKAYRFCFVRRCCTLKLDSI